MKTLDELRVEWIRTFKTTDTKRAEVVEALANEYGLSKAAATRLESFVWDTTHTVRDYFIELLDLGPFLSDVLNCDKD